jgi:integrase
VTFPPLQEIILYTIGPFGFIKVVERRGRFTTNIWEEKVNGLSWRTQNGRNPRHNLRHSLSNWLVNQAKVDPKTVQEMLRHSKVQTTLDLYTQGDNDNKISAQDRFCGLIVDQPSAG